MNLIHNEFWYYTSKINAWSSRGQPVNSLLLIETFINWIMIVLGNELFLT